MLLTIPFWTSYLLRVFAWKIILGFNGVINSGLMQPWPRSTSRWSSCSTIPSRWW